MNRQVLGCKIANFKVYPGISLIFLSGIYLWRRIYFPKHYEQLFVRFSQLRVSLNIWISVFHLFSEFSLKNLFESSYEQKKHQFFSSCFEGWGGLIRGENWFGGSGRNFWSSFSISSTKNPKSKLNSSSLSKWYYINYIPKRSHHDNNSIKCRDIVSNRP